MFYQGRIGSAGGGWMRRAREYGMQIEEIIRSCRSESVAHAAVASIGPKFAQDVASAAQSSGMSVGGFTSQLVERFARQGDEAQMRSVRAAMNEAQQPVLAGLERILTIRLCGQAEGEIRL
jgi:hypothetical protein